MKTAEQKTYKYETIDFTYEGRRYKARGKTPEEASENKRLKIVELEAGKAAYVKERKNILFKDYTKKWENTFNKSIEAKTRADIHQRIETFINPHIGHFRMKDITRSDVTAIFNDMTGYSKDRISKVRQTLMKILVAAYDDGYLAKVPNVHAGDMPECSEPAVKRAITPYERELTLRVAEYHQAGGWILMMLYCGLRPQEASALHGRHIDRKNMVIIVEQAWKDGYVGKTKTNAGKRTVPIPPQLLPYLPKVDPFDYMFKSSGRIKGHGKGRRREPGLPLNQSNARRLWESFKREMNIAAGCKVYNNALVPPYPIADDLTPYSYRHTFGCDCAVAGMDIDLLSKLMGHSNISTTSKYYLHLTDERLDQAAALMGSYHSSQNNNVAALPIK